jgi:hypothetical protein
MSEGAPRRTVGRHFLQIPGPASVHPAALAVHADLDADALQRLGRRNASELAATDILFWDEWA